MQHFEFERVDYYNPSSLAMRNFCLGWLQRVVTAGGNKQKEVDQERHNISEIRENECDD